MPKAENHVPPTKPAEPGGTTLLDLTSDRKTKRMKGRELVLPSGTYQASPTTLALPLFAHVAKAECADHPEPPYMEIGDYHDEEETLTCHPVLEKSKSTVSCRWDERGYPFIDMLPIIIAKDILVPDDTNISIPVSTAKLSNGQEVVLLHMGSLSYSVVERGRGKKKSGASTSGSTSTTEKNA